MKNTKYKKISIQNVVIVFLLILLTVIGITFYMNDKENQGLKLDENVITGETSKEDLTKKLQDAQKKVDEGMVAIDIAPTPIFEDGSSEGQVMIGNPAKNTKDFVVEFVLDDNEEVVYKSGLIPPNGYIEKAKLSKDLEKGIYPTVAYFTTYDAEGIESGRVGLNITIKILN